MSAQLKKILVEMRHGLGDCVCQLPMLKALREKNPQAYIAVIVHSPANAEILRHSKIPIDDYFYLSLKEYPLKATIKTLMTLRKHHFDEGYLALVTPPKKGKLLFSLLNVKARYGEQYLQDNKGFYWGSFIDRNIDLVADSATADSLPHLYLEQEKNKQNRSKKKIIVNIGGGEGQLYEGKRIFPKQWPGMLDFVNYVLQQNQEVTLMGGVMEKELIKSYEKMLSCFNVTNMVGKLSIAEAMSELATAGVVVGVDTGMQHVAAALGIPTVTIFGPTNPAVCGPRGGQAVYVRHNLDCQPCIGTRQWVKCEHRNCLRSIEPEMVYQQVLKVLND